MDLPDSSSLLSATSQFYTANPSLEDGRLKAHRIEFEVTLRTILRLLPNGTQAKVLDVGGGTGPYSFALAEQGHSVTLIDVSPGLLALARSRVASSLSLPHPIRILDGNALELSSLLPATDQTSFDAVLLLGPLYHIMSPVQRDDAIRQAWTMVKPTGFLVCAWVSRWAHYRDVATREPSRLALKRVFYEKHATDGDYVRLDDMGAAVHAMNHELPANMPLILKSVTGIDEVKMVGVEGLLSGNLDKFVNQLDGDAFEAWVQKCLQVGQDDNGWMMSDHIIGIVCKP